MTPEQLASAINELYDTWTFQTRKLIADLIRQRDCEVYEAGQIAMRERAAKSADRECELAQDNINEGYDLKYNVPAEKTARRIAFGIRSLTPEEMP